MSKHIVIVFLVFQLFHHGIAEDTDAMMKKHTEALRGERLKLEKGPLEKDEVRGIFKTLNTLPSESPCDDPYGVTELVNWVIERKRKPLDHSFPSVVVKPPTAEMSQAELEFCWEALALTLVMLDRTDVSLRRIHMFGRDGSL
ncbi:hypothetical protein SeLEV6574_g02925 [Synchytrium endobioticum]|nr:hypothetical protein SeLEV6574_g02925 [Synchytrium endobioticum]